jgi:glyoxylate reductase
MGRIGQAVAKRAAAFGMRIAYHSRTRLPADAEAALGAEWRERDELVAGSDVLTLHAPLTADTRGFLDADAFGRMRRGSYLVNTSRGGLVREDALVDALRGGHLAGAGLDVYEHEPAIHPGLLELDSVVLLPHVGSATLETRTRMATLAARNAAAVLRGEDPPNRVA